MVKPVRHAGVCRRAAIHFQAASLAAPVAVWRPQGVVGYGQIQKAVVVVVEPGGLHAYRVRWLYVQARSGSDVRERPVSVVVVKSVFAGIRDKEVRPAVVVIIAGRDAVAEIQVLAGNTGRLRNVLECTVTFISEQAIVKRRAGLLQFRQFGAISEKDVHEPIVVIIQDRNSAAHWLLEVLPACKIVVCAVGDLRS